MENLSRAVLAIAAALLMGLGTWSIAPPVLAATLPLHAELTGALLGPAFEVEIRMLEVDRRLEMSARAMRSSSSCGAGVRAGDAWLVRTSALHVIQQWWIASAALLASFVPGARSALRGALYALPIAACLQFVTLPVILAAGVLDVTCARSAMLGWPVEPSMLRMFDAVLQNGGSWFLSLLALGAGHVVAHRRQPARR